MTYHTHDACHRWALVPEPTIPSFMAVLYDCLGQAFFSFSFFSSRKSRVPKRTPAKEPASELITRRTARGEGR